MSFFSNMEAIIKAQGRAGLEHQLHYFGTDIKLFRGDKGRSTAVYGKHAGEHVDFVSDFIGIVIGDDFFPADGAASGNFEEGFLYTICQDVRVSDVIQVDSKDKKMRRYRIDSFESLGTQDTVFGRWKIINLAQ